MKGKAVHPLKVAILDLYDNAPNQGVRCLQDLLARSDGRFYGQSLAWDVHVTRHLGEVPGLDYDIYISSGGRRSSTTTRPASARPSSCAPSATPSR